METVKTYQGIEQIGGEGETERERVDYGGRETTLVKREKGVGWREKMALVDFDHWLKSTPVNF
jgi:hypothetical protein